MANIIDLDSYTQMIRDNLERGPTVLAVASADATLSLFIGNLDHAKGYRSVGLVNFAFSTWRTAAVLSKAGNASQIPSLLRLSLESMLYAHLFMHDSGWLKIWSERGTNPKSRDNFRRNGFGAARAAMQMRDKRLFEAIISLYDEMIDTGGHPNSDAIELMTTMDFKPGEENGTVYFSHLGDGAARHLATVNVVRAADQILCVAKHIWPERYELYGIRLQHKAFREQAITYIRINETIKHQRFTPPIR
ncbi:hypothetical protein JWJ88_08690 [Paracoccus methylovorus]|uniref:Uncharacterized protein n=1 Tax=Paracoccus methylovorus TaxID=2812658 RepID=A0ABX7JEM1_9RHOB|nr:hypothetical protein [Paracoccus methylovorus]QRZ12685.1 hypothetical protein JWJ88_08690 [Paracoccus methylovorus]